MAPLELVLFGLWIYCIVDAVVSDKTAVRSLPKWLWVVLVVVLPPFGPIAWLIFGRPPKSFSGGYEGDTASVRRPRSTSPARRLRPVRAERPEDIGDIEARIAERDRLLAKWAEEDRKRSEDS
ncbi:MAG: PLDc N-terminal domain-containing protein [Acidimicrobiales bacterium]